MSGVKVIAVAFITSELNWTKTKRFLDNSLTWIVIMATRATASDTIKVSAQKAGTEMQNVSFTFRIHESIIEFYGCMENYCSLRNMANLTPLSYSKLCHVCHIYTFIFRVADNILTKECNANVKAEQLVSSLNHFRQFHLHSFSSSMYWSFAVFSVQCVFHREFS